MCTCPEHCWCLFDSPYDKTGHCRGVCFTLSHHCLRPEAAPDLTFFRWWDRSENITTTHAFVCLFKSLLPEVCPCSAYRSLKSWTKSWVNAAGTHFFSRVGSSKWKQPVPYRDCQSNLGPTENCSCKGVLTVICMYHESSVKLRKVFSLSVNIPFLWLSPRCHDNSYCAGSEQLCRALSGLRRGRQKRRAQCHIPASADWLWSQTGLVLNVGGMEWKLERMQKRFAAKIKNSCTTE